MAQSSAAVVDLQEFRRKREAAQEKAAEQSQPSVPAMMICWVPVTYWPVG